MSVLFDWDGLDEVYDFVVVVGDAVEVHIFFADGVFLAVGVAEEKVVQFLPVIAAN